MFNTGDAFSGQTAYYVIPVDSALWVDMELENALYPLTKAFNWEPTGAVTSDEAASEFAKAFDLMYALPNPAGMIVPYGGDPSAVPSGALLCDGTLYATSLYPALFSVIGYTFGGSGSSFAVPDLRNRVPVGVGGSIGGSATVVGDNGGELEHVLTESEIPVLGHTVTPHAHTYIEPLITPTIVQSGAGVSVVPTPSITGTASDGIANHGSGGAHNNLQPYLVVTYVILIGG